ncbi:hypothetical protein LCGC14_1750220, partial [marine sediment metagenome]
RQRFTTDEMPENECDTEVEFIMNYLHSQGVVIKVAEISDDVAQTASDGETRTAIGRGMTLVSTSRSVDIFRSFKDMGYVAVEPLKGDKSADILV